MQPNDNGGFSVVPGVKKAEISKLRTERKAKKASAKTKKVEAQVEPDIPDDDDDIDLDAEE